MKNQPLNEVLRKLISQPIGQEAEVIYFIVEIRKLIEGMENRYTVLTFFCDWILHNHLDRKAAKEIISEFDALVSQGSHLQTEQIKDHLSRVAPLISLSGFRNDLMLVLSEHGLHTTLVRTLSRWGPFLNLYVDIISRTPLTVRHRKSELKSVDTITVSKYNKSLFPNDSTAESFMFGIRWSLKKGDQEIGSISNEVWFPQKLTSVRITTFRAERDSQGKMKTMPLESKSFWN